MNNFDDKPIRKPLEDRFGFDPFASAIADTIRNLESPEGSVISINGPWGTGKSSIVNLVKHHLSEAVENDELRVIDFNCWWFRGEEALALEFFRELYSATDTAQSTRAKEAVSQLGSRILSGSSSFVGAAINFFGAAGAGEVASGGMNILSELIKEEKTVESFHKEVSDELSESSQRFLIVIDDIDRLSPDEALLIFRLVKSVGRLPNVMYLMAYDRAIAERVVSDRYPSEGPQYLEKIVQAGFDIPSPPQSSLINSLIAFLDELWAAETSPEVTHFWNLVHDIVTPEIKSPRDVHRVINTLRVSWKAVAGEVDPVEFLCVETLRVQRPQVYSALRENKGRLTNAGQDHSHLSSEAVADLYDNLFLSGLEGEEKEHVRRALRRLFPALDSVWGNMCYGSDFFVEWDLQRRVCSRKHFDTYFRFSLADHNISVKEIGAIFERCDDRQFVQDVLLEAKETPNGQGGTRAASLLEELNVRAKKVPLDKAVSFLSGLFSVQDEIDTDADESRGFASVDNRIRTHWVMRSLVIGRTTLSERSQIIVEAAEASGVEWLVHLSWVAYREHHPREGKLPEPEDNCLTTESHAVKLREMALEKIEETASDGSLLNCRRLVPILYQWDRLLNNEDCQRARAWCHEQFSSDAAMTLLASAFVSTSWTQGMGGMGGALGDTVAVRNEKVSKSLEDFFEPEAFKARVEELLVNSQEGTTAHSTFSRFLAALANDEEW